MTIENRHCLCGGLSDFPFDFNFKRDPGELYISVEEALNNPDCRADIRAVMQAGKLPTLHASEITGITFQAQDRIIRHTLDKEGMSDIAADAIIDIVNTELYDKDMFYRSLAYGFDDADCWNCTDTTCEFFRA